MTLPELIDGRFVSRPILFTIENGRRFAGYYHMNGFFYVSDSNKYEEPICMARHTKTECSTGFATIPADRYPLVKDWEYI